MSYSGYKNPQPKLIIARPSRINSQSNRIFPTEVIKNSFFQLPNLGVFFRLFSSYKIQSICLSTLFPILASLTLCSSPVPIKSQPMVVTFTDLHAESGVKSLDEFLAGKSYLSGESITKDDIKVYGAVLEKPGSGYPNASKWYEAVSAQLVSSFPGKAVGVRFGGSTAEAPVETKEAAPAAAGDDDDDLDLFGDETEEEAKAAEVREKAKKDSRKKKESGKSSVLMDVKPWDDETDMKKLEEAVRSVELPGLLWGASKLVAVGYGIKKLHIMMTIVDDLVSVDDLIEDYLTAEPRSEYIQSCDIVAFNKI